jgi:hypothetical protein
MSALLQMLRQRREVRFVDTTVDQLSQLIG